MSTKQKSRKTLLQMYQEMGTWELVAQKLAQQLNEPISRGSCMEKWLMVRTCSPKIIRALGLQKRRIRRCCEFQSIEQLNSFVDRLAELGVSISTLCRGIADGSITISIQNDAIIGEAEFLKSHPLKFHLIISSALNQFDNTKFLAV